MFAQRPFAHHIKAKVTLRKVVRFAQCFGTVFWAASYALAQTSPQPSPQAAANFPPPPFQTIRVKASGKCLDADTNTIDKNGTIVQLWECTGGKNQQWQFELFTPGFTYAGRIKNMASGRCLDADLATIGKDGTKVQLWDCSKEGTANQIWQTDQYWPWTKSVEIKNEYGTPVNVLDADGYHVQENGAKVMLWHRKGADNQQWIVK